jgi:hypothetical protein
MSQPRSFSQQDTVELQADDHRPWTREEDLDETVETGNPYVRAQDGAYVIADAFAVSSPVSVSSAEKWRRHKQTQQDRWSTGYLPRSELEEFCAKRGMPCSFKYSERSQPGFWEDFRKSFTMHGFVVLREAAAPHVVHSSENFKKNFVRAVQTQQTDGKDVSIGNRGWHRWSFSGMVDGARRSALLKIILEDEGVSKALDALMDKEWAPGQLCGDVALEGATFQSMHSDYTASRPWCLELQDKLMHRRLDPAMVIASVVSSPWDLRHAPLCIVPWSFVRNEAHYNHLINRGGTDDLNHTRIRVAEIDRFTVLAQPGDILVRDVRCPHMGTPHWGEIPRAMTGIIAYRAAAVLMDPSLYRQVNLEDLESKSKLKVWELDEKLVREEHYSQRKRYGDIWTYWSRSLGSQMQLDRGSSLGEAAGGEAEAAEAAGGEVEEVDEAEAAGGEVEEVDEAEAAGGEAEAP